jgi:MFS family permease
MVAQMSAIYLLTTHGVLHLTDLGFTDMQAASALGNLIFFSGLARFPMGLLGDRVEPRWIMTIALAGMAVAMIGIWRAPADFALLLPIVAVFGFCFGSIVPIFPAMIGNYFGPSAFAPITGFLSPVMILIGAPVPFAAGLIYDRFDSYDLAFIYVIVFTFVTALVSPTLIPPRKKQQP